MTPLQAREVKAAKDVAQQNKLAKVHLLQHGNSFFRPADIGTQVNIGKDQRVTRLDHAPTGCPCRIAGP